MLCLCVKHPENQLRVAAASKSISLITGLLNCSSPRIQGLTAGLVRALCPEQPKIRTMLVAHGALANLVDLTSSKDLFAQEQGVAAILNTICDYPASHSFLRPLGILEKLFNILNDSSKPTELAYTCALSVLWCLCKDNEETADRVRTEPGVVQAILRFCHPSSSPRLRSHANRLAVSVVPDLHATNMLKHCNMASLTALRPFKVTPPPVPVDGAIVPATEDLVEAPQPKQILCAICLDDQALGVDGTPKDMVFLPCFHPFHAACIFTWLHSGPQNDSCPFCKLPVLANVNRLTGQTLLPDNVVLAGAFINLP
jgi:hypothetical protein